MKTFLFGFLLHNIIIIIIFKPAQELKRRTKEQRTLRILEARFEEQQQFLTQFGSKIALDYKLHELSKYDSAITLTSYSMQMHCIIF
jgi:hypothetical protein